MTDTAKKNIISPVLRVLKRFARTKNSPTNNAQLIRFEDGFQSWEDAKKHASGYVSRHFFNRIRNAAKAVADGTAAYERDSVVFDRIQYSWPLLASILFAAANLQRLRLIDFGGLGTSFQQNRKFLTRLEIPCEWRIVEQGPLVEIGRREFTNEYITFYKSIAEAQKDGVDAVLFSGVLGYLENPYQILREAIESRATYIVFDRTRITSEATDTFVVQHEPPSIYEASVPLRAFNYHSFLSSIQQFYELIEEWVCALQGDPLAPNMGFLFKRK